MVSHWPATEWWSVVQSAAPLPRPCRSDGPLPLLSVKAPKSLRLHFEFIGARQHGCENGVRIVDAGAGPHVQNSNSKDLALAL